MDEKTELKLDETVTGDEAETLAGNILALRGSPLMINASNVNRIDTPSIEVLLAAKKLWADEDGTLNYSETSEAFEGALSALGLAKNMMETGESI